MINIYDGSMLGMPEISGGVITNVLKTVLTGEIGKEKPDAVNGKILSFNNGYSINKDAFYTLHVNSETYNVTCENVGDSNTVSIKEEVEIPAGANVYLSLRKPEGWVYSIDSNNYHRFTNKHGAVFITDNGVRWHGTMDGVYSSFLQAKIVNGKDYIILANDDMFVIGCNDSAFGMIYTFYISNKNYMLITGAENYGGTAAPRSYIIDGVLYSEEIISIAGKNSQYALIGDNNIVAYISDVYIKGLIIYKVDYLKQIVNSIDNLENGYSARYKMKQTKEGKYIFLLMNKTVLRAIPFFCED